MRQHITSLLPAMNLDVRTVIDLGPGDRNSLVSKTIPLVKACRAKKYVGVDMAEIYARDAASFIGKTCKVKSHASVSNFLEESLHVKESKALLFMGGSTISNIPVGSDVKEVVLYLSAQLAKFRTSVDDKSYMLIGFDCNQHEGSLNEAYQTDLHARLAENVFWYIARDTDISFNPNCFEYQGKWIAKEHRYAHNAFVKKSCVVRLGEEEIQLRRGDVLHLDNSYKFPVEMFARAAQNADWQVMHTWTKTGRAHYMLLSAQPLPVGKIESDKFILSDQID